MKMNRVPACLNHSVVVANNEIYWSGLNFYTIGRWNGPSSHGTNDYCSLIETAEHVSLEETATDGA